MVSDASPSEIVAALTGCLVARAEAARSLGAAIARVDGAAAAEAYADLLAHAARLPALQRALGEAGALSPDKVHAIRAAVTAVGQADGTIANALGQAGSSSLPAWLLAHGQATDEAMTGLAEILAAPPWNPHRDLVALVGRGSADVAARLQARGQSRVLSMDETAPCTPPALEGPQACRWNVHGLASLGEVTTLMAWPLPERVRVATAGPDPAVSEEALRTQLLATLEFAGVDALQMLEEAHIFAAKASRNLAAIARTPSVATLRGALEGLPAVVVSAGPSLDKNIAQLRALQGRAVIVAINQTVASLRRHGVRADVVLTVDPLNVSYHFEGTRPGDIGTLVLGASVDPSLFAVPCDRLVTLASSPLVETWIYDFLDENASVGSGGTVPTGAIKLCAWLGCSTIISIGRDLALAGGQYYASSSADGASQPAIVAGGKEVSFAGHTAKLRLGDGLGDDTAVKAFLAGQVYKLSEVPGFFGTPVTTTDLFVHEIERLRRTVAELAPIRFINATEGGAFLAGMEHMTLAQAAQELPSGPIDVDARIAARLGPGAPERARKMLDHLAAFAADLRSLASFAREIGRLSPEDQGDRRAKLASDIAAISRTRPFLSVLVQSATRAIVRKDGDELANLDELEAAEARLFTAIANIAEMLEPPVARAVAELG